MSEATWEDPIVKVVRAVRDSIARKCNYDLRELFKHIKAHEQASGRQFVTHPPNRTEPDRGAGKGAA